jgi:hypothetical protein
MSPLVTQQLAAPEMRSRYNYGVWFARLANSEDGDQVKQVQAAKQMELFIRKKKWYIQNFPHTSQPSFAFPTLIRPINTICLLLLLLDLPR